MLSARKNLGELQAPRGFEFGKWAYPNNKIEARGEFQSLSERFYLFIDTRKNPSQRGYAEEYLALHKQTPSDIDLAGREAKKAEFEDTTGYYHRIIFTHTATRVFTLHTVSRHKDEPNAIRFVNSFKLHPSVVVDGAAALPAFAATSSTSEEPRSISPLTSPQEPGRSQVQGSRSGQGSGSGPGSGPGSGTGKDGAKTSAPSQPSVSELKILYRHKASYTDFARFYSIQGTVLLRVTFLSSGEIGSITNIRTLPFGLTESAIDAAKRMRFEPEKINGVARNTSRPVSFTFSIY